MTASCVRRLKQELVSLARDPPEGISASPSDESLMAWDAVICGPSGTPYEDGIFELSLVFTGEYPFKPPRVKFVSEVFHPNVAKDGRICLDILDDTWSPSMDIRSIMVSIQSLLVNPDIHLIPDHAANQEAESLYVRDKSAYASRIRDLVRKQIESDTPSTTEPNSFVVDLEM